MGLRAAATPDFRDDCQGSHHPRSSSFGRLRMRIVGNDWTVSLRDDSYTPFAFASAPAIAS